MLGAINLKWVWVLQVLKLKLKVWVLRWVKWILVAILTSLCTTFVTFSISHHFSAPQRFVRTGFCFHTLYKKKVKLIFLHRHTPTQICIKYKCDINIKYKCKYIEIYIFDGQVLQCRQVWKTADKQIDHVYF